MFLSHGLFSKIFVHVQKLYVLNLRFFYFVNS